MVSEEGLEMLTLQHPKHCLANKTRASVAGLSARLGQSAEPKLDLILARLEAGIHFSGFGGGCRSLGAGRGVPAEAV